jgi:hypothetical protein
MDQVSSDWDSLREMAVGGSRRPPCWLGCIGSLAKAAQAHQHPPRCRVTTLHSYSYKKKTFGKLARNNHNRLAVCVVPGDTWPVTEFARGSFTDVYHQ